MEKEQREIDAKEERHLQKWDRCDFSHRSRVFHGSLNRQVRQQPSKQQLRQAKQQEDRRQLSAITSRVFVCDEERAKTAKPTEFALHLNCAPELLLPPRKGLEVLSIRYKVARPLEQLELFEEAAKAMQEAPGTVLVNCARGRSRSVAVVLFFLIKYEHMTLAEAYCKVKAARPFAGPSRHLQVQLDAIELHLFQRQSFDPTQKWAAQVKL